MSDEVLEERELSVEQYLALYDAASADYEFIHRRSANIKSIHIKKLKAPSGQLFEDSTFVEKSGVTWTVRAKL
jgi:hypothetical protein